MSKSKLLAEKACVDTKAKLEKLGIEEKIQKELDWVIGSYNYDKNSVGLIEVGSKALGVLKKYQTEKPRLVTKKFIENLEKAFSKN